MFRIFVTCLVIFTFSGVIFAKPLPAVKPAKQGFSVERLERITQMTQQYVDEGKLAG